MDAAQGRKILVLHEDPAWGDIFRRILAKCRDEVKFIPNGREGLEAAQQERPDIIFIYLWTPGLNAFEFYAQLHQTDILQNIPVVFYGAMPAERAYPMIRPLQVAGYLLQPFALDDLIEVRNAVLNGEAYFP